MEFKGMTADQLYQLRFAICIEYNREETKIIEKMRRVVRSHFRHGAVIYRDRCGAAGREKWTIIRKIKNVIWYKWELSICGGIVETKRLNLSADYYSAFLNTTSIKRNGKVVYRRCDFLRKHKATCILKSWALKR